MAKSVHVSPPCHLYSYVLSALPPGQELSNSLFGEALRSVASALNYNSTSSHTSIDNKYSGLGLVYRRVLVLFTRELFPLLKHLTVMRKIGIFIELLSFSIKRSSVSE